MQAREFLARGHSPLEGAYGGRSCLEIAAGHGKDSESFKLIQTHVKREQKSRAKQIGHAKQGNGEESATEMLRRSWR